VFARADVDRAFSVLMQYLAPARGPARPPAPGRRP